MKLTKKMSSLTSMLWYTISLLSWDNINLKDIGISQVERKNYDQHMTYFQTTSTQGGQKKTVTLQIMERENRMLDFRKYPDGEQLPEVPKAGDSDSDTDSESEEFDSDLPN